MSLDVRKKRLVLIFGYVMITDFCLGVFMGAMLGEMGVAPRTSMAVALAVIIISMILDLIVGTKLRKLDENEEEQ